MNITNLKKITEDYVKRNKDCLLRNQFCRGLSTEDALMLKKSFEELLVSLIMELEENDSFSEAVLGQCALVKATTKELTLILGSANREQALEETVRGLNDHLKALRGELETVPTDANANEFESVKSHLKTLHDYYSKKDVAGAQDTLALVEAHVTEVQQCTRTPEDTVRPD
jgi:negative regulator of genetic competence, sporulation and motility